jgi:transcriptional regulator with XRE-family HTH domain
MADVFSKRDCEFCGGSGKEYDRKTINHLINKSEKELQEIAAGLGIGASYLSKLMRGTRKWSPALIEKLLEQLPKSV